MSSTGNNSTIFDPALSTSGPVSDFKGGEWGFWDKPAGTGQLRHISEVLWVLITRHQLICSARKFISPSAVSNLRS